MGTSLAPRKFLTPGEIATAYQAIREFLDPQAHVLLEKLEHLAQVDHAQCRVYTEGLADLNEILAENGEPATCPEELDRAGVDVWSTRTSRWPGRVERSEAVRDEHDWTL